MASLPTMSSPNVTMNSRTAASRYAVATNTRRTGFGRRLEAARFVGRFLSISSSSSTPPSSSSSSSSCSSASTATTHGRRRGAFAVNALTANASGNAKVLWCKTNEESVILEAMSSGISTFLFESNDTEGEVEAEKRIEVQDWIHSCMEQVRKKTPSGSDQQKKLANSEEVRVLFKDSVGTAVYDSSGKTYAKFYTLQTPEDTLKLSKSISESVEMTTFIVSFGSSSTSTSSSSSSSGHSEEENSELWKIIPVENLIAAKGMRGHTLLAVCKTANEAETMLNVLESGTDGICLETDDSSDFAEIAQYLKSTNTLSEKLLEAEVLEVSYEGMGDRACVDLCSNLEPGEGLLVGSFSRGLFLVHSECEETQYINSRPFRVNAGPVHSYVKMPNDRTAYLSELAAGDQVLVVNPQGEKRVATVGRVKIEHRPLARVEAKLKESGDVISIFLQNAETVKLVGKQPQDDWAALPVTTLKAGMKVLCSYQAGARHTGIPVEEKIVER